MVSSTHRLRTPLAGFSPLRPRLVDRYMLGRLARPGAATLALTLSALLLERTLRLIHELSAAGGRLSFVIPLMADQLPYYLALALPAAFFIALFVVFAGLDEGGEIDGLLAGGLSFRRIVSPFAALGVVLAGISLILFGWLEPIGRYDFRIGQVEAAEAGWAARLEPGVIAAPREGVAIAADKVGLSGRQLKGLFLVRREPDGRETITTARSGALSLTHHGRDVAMVMQDGGVFRDETGRDARQVRFTNYGDLEPSGENQVRRLRGADERELTLTELLSRLSGPQLRPGPGHAEPIPRRAVSAEFAIRLARSAALPLLPFLALPFALAARRGGRAAGVVAAGATLALFHHVVQLTKSLVADGTLNSAWPIYALYAAFAALVLGLFASSSRSPGDNPVNRLTAAAAGAAARLRLPALPRVGGASLGGYIARRLAVRTAGAALGMLALLQVVDLQESTPGILDRGLGLAGIARFEMYRLPAMLAQLAPFAMMVGAVFTFTELIRRNETVAMQAAGVSVYKIFQKALPIALAVAALDMLVAGQLAPRAQGDLSAWWTSSAPGKPVAPPPRWFRAGDEIVQARSIAVDGTSLKDVRIYRRDAQRLLSERVVAGEARWSGGRWTLDRVVSTRADEEGARQIASASSAWPTRLKPQDLVRIRAKPQELATTDLIGTWLGGKPTDKGVDFLRTRLNRALAEPLAALVMLLLAAPILVGAGERSRRSPYLAFALSGGLLFLVSDALLTAMGETGELPSLIAAWTAPIIFAAAGTTALTFAEG